MVRSIGNGGNAVRKLFGTILLIGMVFMTSCVDRGQDIADYKDTDAAAIVNGEVITVGELRFLYQDDRILDNLDGTIKAKLAEQEVKKWDNDLSEIQVPESMTPVYPSEEDDSDYATLTREFAEAQSAKLGMEPEDYFDKHTEKTNEMVLYLTAYIEEKLGEPTDDNVEAYNERANELLNKLVEENEDGIEREL